MLKLQSILLCSCLAALLAVAPTSAAWALTWQLERIQGRERLTITLDEADQPAGDGQIERTGARSVGLGLAEPAELAEPVAALSVGGDLVNGLSLGNGQLSVDTATPAFGFVSSRPAANVIVIDFYPDPLGARWQPSGGLAAPGLLAETQPVAANPEPQALPEPVLPPVEQAEPPAPEPDILADITPEVGPEVGPDVVEPRPAAAEAAEPAPGLEPDPLISPPVQQSSAPAAPETESAPQPVLESGPESTPEALEPPDAAWPVPPAADQLLDFEQPSDPPSFPEPFLPSESDNLSDLPPFDGPSAQAPIPAEPLFQGPPLAPADPNFLAQTPPVTPEPIAPEADSLEADNRISPSTAPETSDPAPSATSQAVQERVQAPYRPGLSGSAPVEVHLAAPTGPGKNDSTIVLMGINPGGPQEWPAEMGVNFSPTGALPQTGVLPLGESVTEGATATVVTPEPAPLPGADLLIPPEPQPEPEPEPEMGPVPQAETAVNPLPPGPDSSLQSEPEPSAEDLPQAQEPVDTPVEAAEHAPAQEHEAPELEPIYMDEEGNIIPKPRDIPADIQQARDLMQHSRYVEAEPLILSLLEEDLDLQTREDLLYYHLEILFERGKPNFENSAAEVIQAANAAMNFNQNSLQIPRALTALALVNLAQDNIAEATAYMNMLRTRNPMHPNVAANFLALGQKLVERHDFAEASAALEIIVQDYPDNPEASEAARLQTYALFNQGRYDRALAMLEFVERRWPRLYINDHDFLSMAAEIRVREGRLPDAINTFWMQYNLEPTKPESATILQRIAELYFQLGDNGSAISVLERLTNDYPGSPELPLALLRIGENGVFPPRLNLDEILRIFEQPNPRLPSLYYARIVNDFPGTPEAVTAQLRSLAWLLWNREYAQALTGADKFSLEYVDRPEAQVAVEIMLRAFAWELGLAINEQNYERVATLWETYPHLQQYYEPLEPDVRLALGRAYLNRGNDARAFEILRPFLADGGDPNYGFYAYTVFLTSLLNQQDWSGVLELGETVANWNLPLDARLQLDYAMALSAENLGLQGRSLPLWQKLAGRDDIPLYQRAYANYFMARDAERRQDLREAYQFNLDTLAMFVELRDQQSPYADNERIRESIAALMDVTEIAGRYAEALDWANQYAAFVSPDSPDYAGLRLREARLHKKMGDNLRWRSILQSIVESEPDSVFGQMAAAELRTEDMARDLSRFTQ